MKRRDFIKSALATGMSLSCGSALAGSIGAEQGREGSYELGTMEAGSGK